MSRLGEIRERESKATPGPCIGRETIPGTLSSQDGMD